MSLVEIDISQEAPGRRLLWEFLRRQPELFDLRGSLARWDAVADGGAGKLSVMTVDELTDFIHERAELKKVSNSGNVSYPLLPTRLGKALLRTSGAGLRPVEEVVRFPLVRRDGTVAQLRGYDAATRRIMAPVVDVKPVSDQPSRREVEAARAVILRLFGGFPFKAASDLAAAVGMYVGPLLRHYLPEDARAPLHVLTATGPGSGKSFLGYYGLDMLYGALSLDAAQSERERGKTIVAALENRQDTGVLAFDNWATGARVTGAALARLVTEPKITGRIIGTARTPEIPNRFITTISGNRVVTAEDMSRRTQVIRLESDAADPSAVVHEFDFLEELRATRGEVLWSFLTMVRAWTAKPADVRPVRPIQLGQFTAWLTTVASILDHAGIEGHSVDRAVVMEAMDEQAADYGRFYAAVFAKFLGRTFRAAEVTQDPTLQDLIPRGEEAREQERRVGHRSLGRNVLRPQAGRVYADPESGEQYTVRERFDRHKKAHVYQVVRIARAAGGALAGLASVAAAVGRRLKARQPERRVSWPQLRQVARERRRVDQWCAGLSRGVRVEEADAVRWGPVVEAFAASVV
ncbi:hypothetical protein [Streptomyces noursei]